MDWKSLVELPWFFGLVVVSGILGATGTLFIFTFFWIFKKILIGSKGPKESFPEFIITGVLMGIVERFFFTFAIWALDGNGALQAAVAWIAMKGQVHYRIFTDANTDVSRAYLGLLGSLVSMAFAILGGYIWMKCYSFSHVTMYFLGLFFS